MNKKVAGTVLGFQYFSLEKVIKISASFAFAHDLIIIRDILEIA